jgi:hypothetical protein
MSDRNWKWKVGEAIERLRTRYQYIGRKTGAPFLAIVYPPEIQAAVLTEWHAQINGLRPEFEVHTIDVLAITQSIVSEIGAENIVDSLNNPMPGSDPISDIGHLWISAVAEAVQKTFRDSISAKPAVSLEKLAALYPAIGPRNIMQALWDSNQETLRGPVIVLIPGTLEGPRTYSFLDLRKEFMYRGDLL